LGIGEAPETNRSKIKNMESEKMGFIY